MASRPTRRGAEDARGGGLGARQSGRTVDGDFEHLAECAAGRLRLDGLRHRADPRAMSLPTSCAVAIRPPTTRPWVRVPSAIDAPAYVAELRRSDHLTPATNPGLALSRSGLSVPSSDLEPFDCAQGGSLQRWDHAQVESPFGPPSRWRHDDLIGVSHAFDELTLSAYAERRLSDADAARPDGLVLAAGPRGPAAGRAAGDAGRCASRSAATRSGSTPRSTTCWTAAPTAGDRTAGSTTRSPGLPPAAQARGRAHGGGLDRDGELAGGLYGVSIGGLFAGESMFHRPGIGRDASKVALVALVELLRQAGADGSVARRAVADAASGVARGGRRCRARTISPASAPPPAAGADWSAN